ncbi:superoxide dismutase [Cavenderia fasciculata]|uniref:Superoxide dismutase [Cu-Zn] n=1 Tax=Cavenderia fasciculata TaxID=261658 RepID=F4Q653_CACFS|nr:superoxide dismutase [Cavenderia fasciculata]EGG16639.1 superoxide dismutase [Cavenderia fasciculata]|eukprot:XP_004355113.1 superoxide dismutase [Cavenderia fasciculata]
MPSSSSSSSSFIFDNKSKAFILIAVIVLFVLYNFSSSSSPPPTTIVTTSSSSSTPTSNNQDKMSLKAVCVLQGEAVKGVVRFTQDGKDAPVSVEYEVTGLKEGDHGFHVHQFGDTTNGCLSAGPHFNPHKKNHGAPTDDERHVGDLGNIKAGADGVAKGTITDKIISLFGEHSIIGRTMIVHADVDDLGKGGHKDSLVTGNAGSRVSCGLIGRQSDL